MRRISARYAKPAMLLGRPLYDCYGKMLLKEGTRLTAPQIASLEEAGVAEIYILDKRVDDVTAWPLVTPELEGSMAMAIKRILQKSVHIVSSGKAQMLDLTEIQRGVSEMLQQLFPVAMGEPVLIGCHSVRDYEFVQPVKVTSLSLLIGKAAGLGESELYNLGMASMLQNVGYTALRQGIAEKVGRLTSAEKNSVMKHPAYGAEIARRYGQVSEEIALIIQQHHERWNGSGYPGKLKQKDICAGARILGITDSVVALVSKRPHRGCILPNDVQEYVNAFHGDMGDADFLRPHQAMEFIVAYSGELFDPELVKIFTQQLPVYPSGITVKLNTGEVGIVSNANRSYFCRPKVRVCYNKNMRDLDKPVDINLADAEHQRILIMQVMDY